MGIFDRLRKKPAAEKAETPKEESKLVQDIPVAAAWAKDNLNHSGYRVGYDLESMKEIERFFCEQAREGGLLEPGKCGSILFALGCLVGESIINVCGGHWETDDADPKGEMNIAVRLPDHSIVWPVQRCMKRLANGPEESLYDYVRYLAKQLKPI